MRTIICRFENQENLDKFNELNHFQLTKNTKSCNLDTGVFVEKRSTNSTFHVDETWKKYWIDMPEFYEPKNEIGRAHV